MRLCQNKLCALSGFCKLRCLIVLGLVYDCVLAQNFLCIVLTNPSSWSISLVVKYAFPTMIKWYRSLKVNFCRTIRLLVQEIIGGNDHPGGAEQQKLNSKISWGLNCMNFRSPWCFIQVQLNSFDIMLRSHISVGKNNPLTTESNTTRDQPPSKVLC